MSERFSSEGKDVFVVVFNVFVDKLEGTNMFWEQLISQLFPFSGYLETVPIVGSFKRPLGLRTAPCPTACESVGGSSVLELNNASILHFLLGLGFLCWWVVFLF